MGTTANYSLPFPDGTNPVVVHTDVKKLADMTDEKLKTTNDRADAAVVAIDNAAFYKGTQGLPMPPARAEGAPWWDALDLLGSKVHTIWNGDVAERYGMPSNTQGSIQIHRWGSAGGVATWKSRDLNPREWRTSRLSGGWVDWVEVGAEAEGGTSTPANRSSGFKTVPLSLTAGNSGATTLATTGDPTYPMWWAAPINRFRVCIVDKNPRYGIDRTNSISFTNLRHGGGTIASSGTFNGSDQAYKSAWVDGHPTGDLAFSYTATNPVIGLVGGGTFNGATATTMPFHVWIEAEVPVGTPVLAIVGDSNAVGVGTTRPLYDSWLSQYCRRIGALPVHYGASGDSLAGWLDPSSYKWNLWDDLDRPDALFLALGSNDMATEGMTQATLQENSAIVAAIAAAKISPILHMIAIKPRNGGDATYNGLRRPYNTWVKTKPLGVRDWHDMVTPVSADDAVMRPGMFASDGTHMTTVGHKALADSITKVITILGGLVFNESAGRTAHAWDSNSQRMQLVYGDTGARDITALVAASPIVSSVSSVTVRRTMNRIEFTFDGLVLSSSGIILAWGTLPPGFRPSASRYGHIASGFNSVAEVTMNTGGGLVVNGATAAVSMRGTTWCDTAQPWATSQPGTAIDIIPYQ